MVSSVFHTHGVCRFLGKGWVVFFLQALPNAHPLHSAGAYGGIVATILISISH